MLTRSYPRCRRLPPVKQPCPRPPCLREEISSEVYATLELRMVRGSLVLIYEAD
jgi:hypothetical protein